MVFNNSQGKFNWTIERCSGDDKCAMQELLERTMYIDEPITSTLDDASKGLYKNETAVLDILDQGHSFKAVTPEGRIVGAAINLACPFPYEVYEPFQVVVDFLYHVSKETKLDSHGLLDLYSLAVDPDFRRQGMAKVLAQATLDHAQNSGFKGLKVCATSRYTSAVCRSIGLQVIYSLAYEDYRDKNGRPVFTPPPPHTHLQVLLKRFQDGEIA